MSSSPHMFHGSAGVGRYRTVFVGEQRICFWQVDLRGVLEASQKNTYINTKEPEYGFSFPLLNFTHNLVGKHATSDLRLTLNNHQRNLTRSIQGSRFYSIKVIFHLILNCRCYWVTKRKILKDMNSWTICVFCFVNLTITEILV